MVVANRYATQARTFIRQAFEELERGDLRQAAEKGWGAAAQIVKAVGEDRGLKHSKHAELFVIVRTLVAETGDRSLSLSFQLANNLHIDFYEGWHGHDDIELSLTSIEEFIDKLEDLPSQS